MHELKIAIIAIITVAVVDWILVGRLAALSSDFEYHYWPPSRPRLATLAIAAATAAASAIAFTPGDMPYWPLFVWAVVWGLWMIVVADDFGRQRKLDRRSPPRYSDRED